ncbi:HU family DNA-binding protein [Actinomadura sp. NAK00032]|uniref:HU family DNA-binding protein n=1 Tax=Actinomadura sp. NAK00032 TaxID=2742128 RepID=UPI0015920A2D|nr:HU family DNA-binding protein [Actinomadura sp. NAK00032]QKW35539.1 HU family DNA-binding protein [Actinomadura sp. NAK00032]
MNRSELVKRVAERAGSDEAAARRHVDAVFDTVMERVSAGERVTVTGFGTFDSFARPARSARNPRTGLPVEVPAAQVPRFRSGQTFRTRVAGDAPAPAAEPEAAVAVAAPVEAPAAKPSKNGKNGKKGKKNAEAKKDAGAKKRPAKDAANKDAANEAAGKKAAAKNGKAANADKNGKNAKKKAGKGKARAKAAS